MISKETIVIHIDAVEEGLKLYIDARKSNTLFDATDTALENIEAPYQLVEGCFYDFAFNKTDYQLGDIGEGIIITHKRNKHTGTISPNIFVGTLSIPIIKDTNQNLETNIELEVQSIKTSYRDDYRDMLAYITEQCTGLLLQSNAPTTHYFDINYSGNAQTQYQRFAFIQSIVGSDDFVDGVHRIVSAPVTKWAQTIEIKDVRNLRRFSGKQLRELIKTGNQIPTPAAHCLRKKGIDAIAGHIAATCKTDSVDTPENRFVKHTLEVFLKFCTDIHKAAGEQKKLRQEALLLINRLELLLRHRVFSEISRPTTLKLNSPILQRKEGYREVLRIWLMFDLAAKLIWNGGDDVYKGGKKDVAILYEYWLFFKLLRLVQDIFGVNAVTIDALIESTVDGLNLRIKQGQHFPIKGIYDAGSRKLTVQFSYNRSFAGGKSYPAGGSWGTTLRPDYTLSFWPAGITEAEAELQELIVHIHFDAKYRINELTGFINDESEALLMTEKQEHNKGIYKNADLLKMHAYKDAIRRTGGAYVLYPGHAILNRKNFHEIIPGLGAFPVRPSKAEDGIGALKDFIIAIINHFINRTSQREKLAYHTFDIFKTPPPAHSTLQEALPEPYGLNRNLLPDNTFVLVGYYKSSQQLQWIQKNHLYNFRTGSGMGALILSPQTVSARYLLLHTQGQQHTGQLWKIVSQGPQIFSKKDLLARNYPTPTQDHYLVIHLAPLTELEFANLQWNFKKLPNYVSGRASAFPFTASLAELMRVIKHDA